MSIKSIAIIGTGAIGGFYGARLARAGYDVRFLARSDAAALAAAGLRVQSPDGDFRVAGLHCSSDPAALGVVDLVVVALKATTSALAALPTLVRPRAGENTLLLTLQNGLGGDELLADAFGAARVLGGLCYIGVERTAPGLIEHRDGGRIVLGEFGRPAGDSAAAVAAVFRRAGIPVTVTDHLAEARWRKLLWNVSFNGLSIVAGGLTTDRILADPGLRRLVRDLMDEVRAGAAALGYDIPVAVAEKQIEQTPSFGAYRTSSLVDFDAGREVEVEAIWGEPLRRAAAAGCVLPRLGMLHALLRALTARPPAAAG